MFFLSSLILSPSSARAAAKDLRSVGLSPQQKQKSSRQWRTKYPDYFRGRYEHQRKSTERVPTTSAATVSNIPTPCAATRLSSKNVTCG